MRRHLLYLIAFIILLFVDAGASLSAQKLNAYTTISTAEGLSQGMIFDLLQDKEGFIWIATKNGLNRYDGYQFKVFKNDPYNSQSLSSNTIVKLFEDSRGRIWVGTENAGLNIYDKTSGQFFRIAHVNSDPNSLSGNEIRSITETPDGKMLVATDQPGINLVQAGSDFYEKGSASVITRLPLPNGGRVYGMGQDKSKQMWVCGMDGSVYRFDPVNNSFSLLPGAQILNNGYFNSDESILISSHLFLYDGVQAIPLFDTVKIPRGNIVFRPLRELWDNHHRELYFYDVSHQAPGQPIRWGVQLPAGTGLVYPFIIDRSGILWSGSVGYGLRKYNTAGSRFKAQLPGYSVRFIVPASGDHIFLGDYGYSWRKLNGTAVEEHPFRMIPAVTEMDNFIITRQGDYWIKSDNKGYFRYSPGTGRLKHYPQINFYKGNGDKQPMLEDSRGYIWIPGLGGMFRLLNTATESIDSFSINTQTSRPMSPQAVITAIYEDKQGIFWLGTLEGFVRCTPGKSGQLPTEVTWFHNKSDTRNSLNYNNVSCFLDDPARPDKFLWIGTKGGGLNRLDKTTGEFLHLTTSDGLPDDVVYTLQPDAAGHIWGSTNRGLFCMQANTAGKNGWTFRVFSKADGLQDDEFNTGASAKLKDGSLAFGGVNGVNIFQPEKILASGFEPNIFITDILINNQVILPGDPSGVLERTIEQSAAIRLTHLQDILTLEFSSLDFTAPFQNKYRYQLTGVDKDWVESGTRRSATYLHLPAGTYVFKVQGTNSQGIWSGKTAELRITVLPPWWRSWGAYIVYALLVVFGVRSYFRFSIKREKLKAQLDVEQLEAKRIKELDTVKTQLYTNITHEFRTPLTVILGMAQQVKENPAAHLNTGMDMIIRNGQSLLNLVNEMLDLSKLETGKMGLQLIQGDIINFLRYIVESFHSLAESQEKQLHFLSELDQLNTRYDPEKLRQIIANLLSNAIKFTPGKGNIYFSVLAQEIPERDDRVSLVMKVKDTGMGIPETELQHIFDRFYRLDNSHTRKTEGTGIGLALTRELVKLMDGEITVKSPPAGASKGTEFTVVLPLMQVAGSGEQISYPLSEATTVDAEIPAAQTNEQAGDKPHRPLVLLVEDNADVVAYTASCLPDYRLAVGKDGKEGFDIATELVPDLVITDVMMPLVDGFEMCRQLRKDERTSHIPIIMLTAKAGIESKLEGLQYGADVYLEKPFHREELLLRIKKLLELRQSLRQYYLSKAGLTPVQEIAEPVITEAAPVTVHTTEDAFVSRVRAVVEENMGDAGFTVEQLCRKIFMSHSQLHRKLDALTGYSPNKYIRLLRLAKAKEMMKDPANSIAAVSYECGYNDPGYFARVFKQELGVTPQEWRSKQ